MVVITNTVVIVCPKIIQGCAEPQHGCVTGSVSAKESNAIVTKANEGWMGFAGVIRIAVEGQWIATSIAISVAVRASPALSHMAAVGRQLTSRLRRHQGIVKDWVSA